MVRLVKSRPAIAIVAFIVGATVAVSVAAVTGPQRDFCWRDVLVAVVPQRLSVDVPFLREAVERVTANELVPLSRLRNSVRVPPVVVGLNQPATVTPPSKRKLG